MTSILPARIGRIVVFFQWIEAAGVTARWTTLRVNRMTPEVPELDRSAATRRARLIEAPQALQALSDHRYAHSGMGIGKPFGAKLGFCDDVDFFREGFFG